MAKHTGGGGGIFFEHIKVEDGEYLRLCEMSDMSVDSQQHLDMSMHDDDEGSMYNNGSSMYNAESTNDDNNNNNNNNNNNEGSVCSSVGSNNNSRTHILTHAAKPRPFVGHSVVHRNRVTQSTGDDALLNALLDDRYPSEGLKDYEDWTIDASRLCNMGPAFAQGAFGRIYKGSYNGESVAVKILERPLQDIARAQAMEQQFVQEVVMLANLRHENVVRFIGACQKPGVWCIVTEFIKEGSLRAFLARKRAPALRFALKYALDIARGMEYLHRFNVIHRDLKSDNLLMAERSIKIADFGVARIEVQSEDMTPETGTYRWMAPEMMQNRSYNHKVDVYSFGIVLWELVTGNIPFGKMSAVQAASAVVRGVRPEIPPDCPSWLTRIMTRCWDANAELRPPFSELVSLLENGQMVGPARFRSCSCLHSPRTLD